MRTYGCHLGSLLLLCVCGLSGCGGGSGGGGSVTEPPPGGTSQNPFDHPTGTPFSLPSSVTIQGAVSGANFSSECGGAAAIGEGSGLVNICLTLHNAGSAPTTVELPAGLIVLSQADSVQSGTSVKDQGVVVPIDGDIAIRLPLFCLHLNRHASRDGDLYTLGPVSNQSGLREIISLVAGKNLGISTPATDVVQGAIWEVSDGPGLLESTRQQLLALP